MGLLTSLFHRRSLENPATSFQDPAEWLVDLAGGGTASSGVSVNAQSALTYAPVWRAVNLIAADVAKLPLVVYKRSGIGKVRDTSHPAYRLLRHRPNREMGFFPFKQVLTGWALVRGNGYAYIRRAGNGNPVELIPLNSATTYPFRVNGILKYAVNVDGETRAVSPQNIFHIHGFGDDGIRGYSIVEKARESLGLGMAAQKYGSIFFKNGARPSVSLEHPGQLTDQALEHLKKSIRDSKAGLDNAHVAWILEEGMKLNVYSFSNEDAQFLETRQFEIREVANWFGVPPHKLGDTTRTAFASLEQENQSYLDEALDPWLVAWECEAWAKLLTKPQQDRDTHAIEFTRNALVRANMKDRGAFYNLGIQGGWLSRDEVRARENMNPLPDGEGAKFFVPLNMAVAGEEKGVTGAPQADQAAAADEAGAEQKGDRATFEKLLFDVVDRMSRRIAKNFERARKRGERGWVDEAMEAEHREVIRGAFDPVVAATRAGLGAELDPDDLTELFFTEARFCLNRGGLPEDFAQTIVERFLGARE